MPFGIGIGSALGLVREARRLEGSNAFIAVSGPEAESLAASLGADGDRGAVGVGRDPAEAVVAIRLVEGEAGTEDIAFLREGARAGTPLVVVRRGGGARLPYVLPGDVIAAGVGFPLGEIAAAIARTASDGGAALAARLPILRPETERRLVVGTSMTNAAIAGSPWQKDAHLPLLTLAQARMLLLLRVCRGDVLSRDPQELAAAVGPAAVGSLGVGLGARALVRHLPARGPLVRAAVAFAGTRALGAARRRL